MQNNPYFSQPSRAPFHSLSRRIVWQFCIFTLALAAVFSLISFVLMYTLEDAFIEKDIVQEARYLTAQYQETGAWPMPRKPNMQLHFSKDEFPKAIRNIAKEEPKRKEFYGEEGRHYHLFFIHQHFAAFQAEDEALNPFKLDATVGADASQPNRRSLNMPLGSNQEVYLLAEVSGDLLVRPIREGIIQFLVGSGLIVSAIACLIAWLVSRKTTQPLKQLATLVDGVAPEQVPKDFAQSFPNNEIGILANALEHSFKRLEQALEREKCFTRDASHELRTPLAVVKNAAELPPSAQTVGRIAEAANQMEKTVHTLLLLAREEHTHSQKEVVNLMSVVEKSVIDNCALLEGKPVDVNIHDSCNVTINSQPGMLKVLLDNLLSNAFAYTLEGEVSVEFSNHTLVVKDTGPGIESHIANHVTEPAIKGSQSAGFGFGLSIVKRLCEHQGWILDVDTQRDTGAEVRIRLQNQE